MPQDLDSVHNDYQRHLPYFWAVPEFEAQKSHLYENCQRPDGMITENPGFFLTDGCGGRTMGDTTTIWLLEILEIYQSTGNLTRLKEVWPAAVKGIQWQIQVSQEFGIPAHLVCTYDILDLQKVRYCALRLPFMPFYAWTDTPLSPFLTPHLSLLFSPPPCS